MNVVAVRTTLALGSGEDAAAASDKEVLAPSAVFAHLHAATKKSGDGGGSGGEELYLADSGSVSPNPATDHLLRR